MPRSGQFPCVLLGKSLQKSTLNPSIQGIYFGQTIIFRRIKKLPLTSSPLINFGLGNKDETQ